MILGAAIIFIGPHMILHVFIHSRSHLVTMATVLDAQLSRACPWKRTLLVNHHMTVCSNVHLLFHGILHWLFLYSYTKLSFNLICQSTAIWFCCVSLYAQCWTVSSASVHTARKVSPVIMAIILNTQLFLLPQCVPHREHSSNQSITSIQCVTYLQYNV